MMRHAIEPTPARGRMGLRVRLLGWPLGMLTLAVVVSLLVVRQILHGQLDESVTADLRQEAVRFSHLTRELNPATGQRLGDDRPALVAAYLARHPPRRHQTVLVFLDGNLHIATAAPFDLSREPDVVRRWNATEQPEYGQSATPAGEARWLVVPIVVDGEVRGHFVAAAFVQARATQIDAAVGWMAAACLLILLLAAAGGYLAMGRALHPLREVTDTARKISESDMSGRIQDTGTDEIAVLARTFNGMLDRLERAFAASRELASDVGHELRTPITIIGGHLELMGDSPAERRATVALVTDELARMSRLVDDLLLLATSEHPDFLVVEPVAVAALLREAYAKASALADRRWQLDPPPNTVLHGDRQRLIQALMQLAHNAARHTRPGDTIRFFAREDRHSVELSIQDSGPGVATEDQQRIFERFTRAGPAHSRGEGAGLGLAIVRAIVEAHNGSVSVDSTPGQGATFTLHLPTTSRASQ